MLFIYLSSFCFSSFYEELNGNKYKSSVPVTEHKIIKENQQEYIIVSQAIGNYANNNYINQHKVPTNNFTAYSPGDQSGKPLSNAFDGKKDTFWASSIAVTETTKSYLTFNFTSLTCIEGIIYGPAFSTNRSVTPNTRRYDGYPLILNVYTSSYDEPMQLRYTFQGSPKPSDIWDYVQYIFLSPIWCDKLKFEFVEVTLNQFFGNGYFPASAQIIFMTPSDEYTGASIINAIGNYAQGSSYITANKISKDDFTAYSPGDKANKPLSNAFDGNIARTYWVTSTSNTETFKNYLTFDFNSPTYLESIIYSMAYSTNRSVTPNTRRYDGIPRVLKVFTSLNGEQFKLNHIFTGGPRPADLWDRIAFVFKSPIWCDKLKMEFTELTLNVYDGNDYSVACGELELLRAPTLLPSPTPAQTAQPDYVSLNTVEATGNYSDNNYVNSKKVPKDSFTAISPGDKSNKPLSNAFDNDVANTYWVTSTSNNETFKNYLIVNFNSLTYIEAILFNMAFSTNRNVTPNTRRYDGIPKVLKVFTSAKGDPLKLNYVFSGEPQPTDMWSRLAFVFQKPIWCDQLKIEFTELTLNKYDGNDYSVACGQLFFIQAIPVPTPTRSALPTATPKATPTASESPSQSPTPERTAHPGADDNTYINKNFTGSIPVSENNQIQLGGNNQIKQISGCRFTDLDITNRQFFIKVNGDSSIFDNIFERTTYTTGKTGCIWYAFGSANKFIISNCKFIRISGKNEDSSVLNVNANTNSHIEFRDCDFIDCGEKGNDRPIVNVLEKDSTIEFYNCYFTYEEPQTSRVLELKGNGATFDGCRFNNCGTNSIDLGIEDITPTTHGVFRFTNNYVHSVNTRFINAPRIRATPVISHNTFETCTLNGKFFIYIIHDRNEIEFVNNTFNDFISRGDSEGECGGLSSFVERSGSKFTLKYNECHFININNEHTNHPSNQGGALQYFSTSNFEVDIELKKCEFKMNKATHHGGAISIRSSGTIMITECNFESNEANYHTTSSKLLFSNFYELKTNGYGGAIYLNPTFNVEGQDYAMKSITISGCTFTKNRAYQGYAIYIEGETSTTTYVINNNNFNNNYESSGSPSTNSIIASEDLTLTKEFIEGNSNNIFNKAESGSESENFMRVDHSGKLLTEGNFVFGDENTTLTQPSERIEKELDANSANEVSVKVTVVVSEISNKVNKDGGAIHIVNCALECTGTTFNSCTSPNGAGGGIYIKNEGGNENTANLVGLTFNKCESNYGGAVYVYSNSFNNPVTIKYCTFTGNKALSTASSSDSKFYGGSAIFLTAKKGDISSNIFRDNEGDGGAVRIYNNFKLNNNNNNVKMLDKDEKLFINDCSFEFAKNSNCCLFYIRGNSNVVVELEKCSFSGPLTAGSHYIDGKTIDKNGPKLFVKKCKFAYDSASSLNMKDYLSVDLNDQSFVFDRVVDKKKNLSITTWMIIAAVCVAAIVAVIVIVVIMVKRKNPNTVEENEMSAKVRDLLLNESSSTINSSLI